MYYLDCVLIFVCSGCHNKLPLAETTEPEIYFFRLEVKSRVRDWRELSLWAADNQLPTMFSHGIRCVCTEGGVSSGVSSSLYKDTNPTMSNPPL